MNVCAHLKICLYMIYSECAFGPCSANIDANLNILTEKEN